MSTYHICFHGEIRPNEKICVFRVTSCFFFTFFLIQIYNIISKYILTKHHNSHEILPSMFDYPLMCLKELTEWQTVQTLIKLLL